MGVCFSETSFEENINKLFNSLPIKHIQLIKLKEFIIYQSTIEDITKIKSLSVKEKKIKNTNPLSNKVSFYKIESFNKYLLISNYNNIVYKYFYFKEYMNEILEFFNEIYALIPFEIKYPILKIIILLFGRFENSISSYGIYIDAFYYYSLYEYVNNNEIDIESEVEEEKSITNKYIYNESIDKMNKMNNNRKVELEDNIKRKEFINIQEKNQIQISNTKVISNKSLYVLLRLYLYSLTNIALPIFMIKFEKKDYEEKMKSYKELWTEKNLSSYIINTFLDKDNMSKLVYINIEEFVKKYIEKLSNLYVLLCEYSDYCRFLTEKQVIQYEKIEENYRLVYK